MSAAPRDRVIAFGPGRVNLIGEHTDYNGGLSLPFAVRDGVTVSAERADDGRIATRALDEDEEDAFALAAIEPAEGWRAFVRGVAAELLAAGHDVPGARLEITGTIPQGSGLSSSAALSVALCLALLGLAGEEDADRRALARLCSRVENDWVGANTGLLDQTASLLGRAGHALRIDFGAGLEVRHVAMPLGDWCLVTVGSGEQHANAAGGYNARRAECEQAAAALGVSFLARADREAVRALPDVLRRRAEHVLEEDDRVDAAVAALEAGDLPGLAALLDASHASLRDFYDSSTPAVERTVDALKAAGAAGARMVGGGFGGHVLGLLPPGVPAPDGATVVAPGDGACLRQASSASAS